MDPSTAQEKITSHLEKLHTKILEFKNFTIGDLICKRNHNVYKGKYKTENGGEIDVVLKEKDIKDYFRNLTHYTKEVEKYNLIPNYNKVPKILGVTFNDNSIFFVKEFIPNTKVITEKIKEVDYKTQLEILIRLAEIIRDFNSNNIVYEKITAFNVLVSDDNLVYLLDFGGNVEIAGSAVTSKHPKSLTFYMPPEYFNTDDFDDDDGGKNNKTQEKSFDVYSFCCLISECLSGIQPWTNLNLDPESKFDKIKKIFKKLQTKKMDEGIIMSIHNGEPRIDFPIPTGLTDDINSILTNCLVFEKEKRLTIEEIIQKLTNHLNSL
jgi:serine/threonine protein kinase